MQSVMWYISAGRYWYPFLKNELEIVDMNGRACIKNVSNKPDIGSTLLL